jgi:hypothetical protein
MAVRALPPPSVVTALSAFAVAIAVQLALVVFAARSGAVGSWQFLFAAVLASVLLVGLALRSRLAWLWSRFLTLALAVMEALALIVGAVRGQIGAGQLAIGVVGLVLPLAAVSLGLSRRSAYAYYGLVCPACGARTSLGATFLFREARCRTCQNVW